MRKEWEDWYKKKFGKPIPVYIPTEEKKKLVAQFEKETKIKYQL